MTYATTRDSRRPHGTENWGPGTRDLGTRPLAGTGNRGQGRVPARGAMGARSRSPAPPTPQSRCPHSPPNLMDIQLRQIGRVESPLKDPASAPRQADEG